MNYSLVQRNLIRKLLHKGRLAFMLLLLFTGYAYGQNIGPVKWQDMTKNKNATFYQVQQNFNQYWQGKTIQKGKGYKVFKRWEAYMAPRVYPSGNMNLPSTAYDKFLQWKANKIASPQASASANWTELGPIGSPSGPLPYTRTGAGRVSFVRFDPNNTNTMYVGAPDGGLWKSINGGASWTTNTDFLTIIGCSDLCIDPTNTQIMYLATGDLEGNRNSSGVFKSTDGGATWNTTAGASWPPTNSWKISKMLMNPSDPLNMVISTNVGIFRTTDGWVTSNFQQAGDFKDMEFKPGDANTVYAAGKEFWKSTDNGVNWVQVTTGLPASNISRYALGVSAGNSAYVYALIGNDNDNGYLGMYRSTNSGTSFSLRSSTPNLLGYETDGSDAGGQAFYDLAVAVSPTNAEVVTTGGINHWQSTDGGTTWTNLSFWASGEVHADIHEINYLPGSGTTMFSCNDGGIFKSTDNGNNFVDISNNLAISQVVGIGLSANVSTTIVNGEQDNGTNLKTGSSWANINGGDGGECFIDPTNNNTIYIQYILGAFSRSDDGGASNNAITTGLPTPLKDNFDFYSTWVMDPVNTSRLYTGGNPTLYISANKGDLWTALGTPSGTGSIKGIAVAPSNTSIIYTIKDNAVSKSINSGVAFSDITGTLPVGSAALTSITVSNTDPNKVWVTFSGYSDGNKVFKSVNGGTSWTNVSAGLPNLPVNEVVYTNGNANDAIYVGADIGVYYLDNTLASFAPFMTALPNVAVRDLEIFYPTGKLRAGTYGRGVWESNLNTPSSVPTITATGTLNAFTACAGTVSAEQTFTVAGTDLTANLVVTAPAGFEVSATTATGFAGSVSFTPSSGTVTTKTVFVRLSASASGTPSGNITCESVGATTQNVAATGTVNAAPEVGPITGNSTLCVGQTSQLGNQTIGGVTTSSNPLVASVNTTGFVTAESAGSATIFYTVTGGNGCSTTVSIVITVNPAPIVAVITGPASVCVGSTTQLADVTPGGVWSSTNEAAATVSTTGLVSGIAPGLTTINYTVTINNCATTQSLLVTVFAVPVVGPLTGAAPLCVGQSLQLGTDHPGGTTSSSNPLIVSDNGSGFITGVAPGSATIFYTVTEFGCSTTVSVLIPVTAPPTANAGADKATCGITPVQMSAVGTGTWTGFAPGNMSSTTNPTATFTPAAGQAGTTVTLTWTVAATAPCAGSAFDNVDVVVSLATECCTPPVITTPTVTQPTCATPTGTIVVNATGGSTLEYQLNSGAFQLSNTFSGLAAGNYNITVRLQNSITCSSTYISNPVVLNAATGCCVAPVITTPTVTQPTCATPTGTIVVNATGGSTLEYQLNAGTFQLSNTFSGLAAGNYNITVRLQNSITCSSTYISNPVVLNAATGCCVAPVITTPTVTQPTCATPTGTIVVNATGGSTLEYQLNAGTFQLSNTFSGLTPGNYNITVRLQNNITCSSTYISNPVVINAVPVAPAVNAPTVTQPTCAIPTGTIVVNATGSGTLEYSKDNGTNWQLSATFSGLAPGSSNTIKVRLANSTTCSTSYSINPVVINAVPVAPTVNAPTVTQPTCATPTGTIVVNATGGSTLEYQLNAGTFQLSNTFSGLAAGNYNITVRLQNNITCSSTYISNPVVLNAATGCCVVPVITAPTVTQPTCATPTGTIVVNATGSGALEYALNNGTYQSSATFSGLTAGNYNITVRLQANTSCIATYSSNPVVLNAATGCCVAPVITTPTVTQPTCATPTGTIVVNATGGSTLEYTVNNGANWQTSNTFNALAAGSYTIKVRLQSSPTCSTAYSSNPVVLNAATGCCVAPVITAPTVTQPTCAISTGTIVVNATGSGALEYRLDNGTNWQSSATFSGLTPGNYNITVRLQSSPTCLSTYSSNPVVINAVPVAPIVNAPTVTQPTCAVPTGTIVVNATGSGTLEYSKDNGTNWQSSATFSGLAAGSSNTIKVRLASSTTCSTSYSVNPVVINAVPVAPTVNAPTVTQPTCAVPTGTIVVNATGSGTLEYSKDNGTNWQSSATFSSLAAGSYNIKVRLQNSPTCITTYSSNPVILIAATPVITAPTVTQPTCLVLTGTIVVNATGSGTLEYSKDNGTSWQTSNTFNTLATGSYNIKVRLQSSPTCITTYAGNPIVLTAASCGGKVIPGKIEAESWDAKSGPQYAVPTNDAGGGQQVIGMANGSWLDYNVTVTQTGTYTVNFRVATSQNNAQFQVKLGATVLGTINIPNTGGWDVWQTFGLTNVALTAGTKTIRIQSTNNESCNFNWMDWVVSGTNTSPSADAGQNQTITLPISQATLSGSGTPGNGGSIISYGWTRVTKPVNASEPTIQPANTASTTVSGLVQGTYVFRLTVTQNDNQTATSDVTVTVNPSSGKIIAGRIEAESFDAKSGGMYAVTTTDVGGGQQVIGITNGSWMDYNVNVNQTGAYTVNFRVATSQQNARFQIKLGANILATVNIPTTGSWDTWLTVPVTNVPLTAGAQTIRIQSINNESCNFNWMDWILEGPNTAPTANAGLPQSITLPTSQVILTGSGTAGNGGTITYAWTRITKPVNAPEPVISPLTPPATTTVSGLAEGVYIFRLTVTQNDNQAATSDVTITVNPVAVPGTKVVNVNLYANNDPYVNTQWNNQLITQASYPFTSGIYNYADGTLSPIFSTISSSEVPTATTYGDNGAGYATTMCPPAVGRYTSYVTGARTVTFKGLDNSKLYDIKLYCSRVTNQGTTRNTINGVNVDINVFGNLANAAAFNNIIPVGGQIVLTQTPLTTFVYLNGFTITEKSAASQPVVNAGAPQIITLPTSTVTLAGSAVPSSGGTIQSRTWSKFSGGTASITDPSNYNTTVTGLSAGTYVFRLTVLQTDNQTAFSDVTITVNPASGKLISGRIEAESWDAKSGPQYAVPTNDAGGGQQVIGMSNGSWLDYNVTVTQTGTYTVNFRIATSQNNAQFQIKLGAAILGTINIPNTGSWGNWQTVAVNNIALTAGAKTIRIQSSNNESCNFNWMDWVLVVPPVAPVTMAATKLPAETEIAANKMTVSVFPNPSSSSFNLNVQSKNTEMVTIKVFDMAGRQVQQLQGVPGQVMKFGDKIVSGTYFVEVRRQGGEKVVLKVVKQ